TQTLETHSPDPMEISINILEIRNHKTSSGTLMMHAMMPTTDHHDGTLRPVLPPRFLPHSPMNLPINPTTGVTPTILATESTLNPQNFNNCKRSTKPFNKNCKLYENKTWHLATEWIKLWPPFFPLSPSLFPLTYPWPRNKASNLPLVT